RRRAGHGARRRTPHERDDGPVGTVNLDDVREILALMRDNGLSEFEIERDGLKLRLRKDSAGPVGAAPLVAAPSTPSAVGPQAAMAATPPVAGAADGAEAGQAEIELAVVKSPIV